jgi:hypothetical protein
VSLNGFCPKCFEKQQEIDRLQEENLRLKERLHYQERKATEGPFGSSTPSSKIPIKPRSLEENQLRRGGGKPGHKGHGRTAIAVDEADHVHNVEVLVHERCPRCGSRDFEDVAPVERSVIDSPPVKAVKHVYRLGGKRCRRCKAVYRAKAPSVMPKALYGNQLVANQVALNIVHGTPMGRLEEMLGISCSAMVAIQHRLAGLFAPVVPRLIEEYRRAPVKHADETSWRTDGANGYVWLFATKTISIFEFRDTRSGSVPAAILGSQPLDGTLVVDRYSAYNKAPCALQYCYSHLFRDLQDLGKEFPEVQEVQVFVATVAPMLALAMGLRMQKISDATFYAKAEALKRRIQAAMRADACHPGVQAYQDIFRVSKMRLYHWAADRRVPADNNLSERDLRPSVIARKVSFGSQSERGAKSRGVLMTVLHSLRKRDPENYQYRFKSALDKLALDPSLDPYKLLFSP